MRARRPQILTGIAVLLLVILGVLAARPWPSPAGAAPLGDASCDGQVNAVDATVILQLTAGLIPSLECPENADTDGDGSVGPVDATLVLQLVAGLIPALEPPATATPTRTRSPTPTATPIATNTPAATETPGLTDTPGASATPGATELPSATSTATATATPNASATATATPTRTPTPLSTVHVRNSSTYTDTFGDLVVVGEVYNGLSRDVAFVNVNATAYSATGEVLGASDPYPTCVSSLAEQTDSPFQALIFDLPAGAIVDHVVVSVITSGEFDYVPLPNPGFDPPVEGVKIHVVDSARDSVDPVQHVVGDIQNQSANVYASLTACIALYDATGVVVRTDFTVPADDPLELGMTTTFESDIDVGAVQIATTRAWVDAYYD